MKKFLLLLLALVLCLSMVACGDKKDKKDKDDDDSSTSEVADNSTATDISNIISGLDDISTPSGSVSDTSIVGKYMVHSVTYGDITVSGEDIANSPEANTYIELKADGTFTMTFGGTINGTYDANAMVLSAEGEDLPFTLNNGMLSITAEGATVVFKK